MRGEFSPRDDKLSVKSYFFDGSCAMIIAAMIKTMPTSSLDVKLSLRNITPQMALKTDSRLISREATVGSVYFWAVTCRA